LALADISALSFVLIYVAFLILFGTILDSASVMILVVPITLPLAATYDLNLIWLGIVTVISIEIGLLTPPFGMSLFAIKSTIEDDSVSIEDIFKGTFPFLAIIVIVLALVIALPSITTVFV
jgi:C4-dicarboxylate transporter DctM subunit